jgi:hypothetical protein
VHQIVFPVRQKDLDHVFINAVGMLRHSDVSAESDASVADSQRECQDTLRCINCLLAEIDRGVDD